MRRIPITDLHTPELQIYNERKEVQLLRYYEPAQGLFIAESPNVILRALVAGYEPLSLLMEQREAESEKGREILERIQKVLEKREDHNLELPAEFPVYVSSNEVLSQITGFKLARGVLCAMRRRALPKMEELCRDARRIAILENVVNPTNVGAIFRCAAALGIDAVLLTAGCSDPLYRRAACSQHGDGIPGALDIFGDGRLGGSHDGTAAWHGIPYRSYGVKGRQPVTGCPGITRSGKACNYSGDGRGRPGSGHYRRL